MKPWRLTPQAEDSLVEIFVWTIEKFGERQALAYQGGLIERINRLASGEPPHARPCAVLMSKRPGYQGHAGAKALTYFLEGGHYIIMRDTEKLLEVLEFFHQSANIPYHLERLDTP